MRLRVSHTTAYSYSAPASLSQNEVYLTPRETATQQVVSSELRLSPQPEYLHRRSDYFGNIAHVFMVQQGHRQLEVTAVSEVLTSAAPVLPPEATLPWEQAVERLGRHAADDELAALQFSFASPMIAAGGEVHVYAAQSFPPGRALLAGAFDLMGRIHGEFCYDKNASTVETSVAEVLASRRGVCQDFAHLAIACLRSLGLAARYVSGYLQTLPPPGRPRLVGADASHAWVSLYVPDSGWVDFDPTNNMPAGESHITVAWGRDYSDVAPVKGVVMGGGTHTLDVRVDVVQLG